LCENFLQQSCKAFTGPWWGTFPLPKIFVLNDLLPSWKKATSNPYSFVARQP